jgi:hypothetical protein
MASQQLSGKDILALAKVASGTDPEAAAIANAKLEDYMLLLFCLYGLIKVGWVPDITWVPFGSHALGRPMKFEPSCLKIDPCIYQTYGAFYLPPCSFEIYSRIHVRVVLAIGFPTPPRGR